MLLCIMSLLIMSYYVCCDWQVTVGNLKKYLKKYGPFTKFPYLNKVYHILFARQLKLNKHIVLHTLYWQNPKLR